MKTHLLNHCLQEDAPSGDITSRAIFGNTKKIVKAKIVAKQSLVVSGFSTVQGILKSKFKKVKLKISKKDGTTVRKGVVLAEIKGPVCDVLLVERLCLNFLQRLSGIATVTNAFVKKAKPYGIQILDTRKTTPGLRLEEKKAVKDGGGANHREGLSDQYLIKDNHIDAAGGVIEAIVKVRAHQKRCQRKALIEVEVRDENEFCEALLLMPDVIMLDNMTPKLIRKLVLMRDKMGGQKKVLRTGRHPPSPRLRRTGRDLPLLEISGNVTIDTLNKFLKLGIDRISIGALTHSAPAVDISMTIL